MATESIAGTAAGQIQAINPHVYARFGAPAATIDLEAELSRIRSETWDLASDFEDQAPYLRSFIGMIRDCIARTSLQSEAEDIGKLMADLNAIAWAFDERIKSIELHGHRLSEIARSVPGAPIAGGE